MRRIHPEFSTNRSQGGFTLIELMIVVAIVAILAVVIVPSYRAHVVAANRSSAQSFMSQVANKEEQVLLDMRSYVTVTGNGTFAAAPVVLPSTGGLNMTVPNDVSNNYTISVLATAPTNAPPTFKITAVPKNPPQNDPECQTLTLDSTGAKGCTGAACSAGPQVCWK